MHAHADDCWILTDGAAGNENQALALAQALDLAPRVWRLAARAPWRWLAPRRLPGDGAAFGEAFRAALAARPRVAIGCGRLGALATRLARDAAGDACRSVQILDPRIGAAHYDLVVAPEHDGLHGANVVTTLGALNAIDDAWLAQARLRFAALGRLPRPITLLAVGGPTRALRMGRRYVGGLLDILDHWLQRDGGSLLVTGSRRTPRALAARLRDRFEGVPGQQWFDAGDGDNPYAGFLAHADRIVVTPDSANLMSEACATGRPVLTHAPKAMRGKLARLHRDLVETGRVRPLRLEYRAWEPAPLRELQRVTPEIRRRLGL